MPAVARRTAAWPPRGAYRTGRDGQRKDAHTEKMRASLSILVPLSAALFCALGAGVARGQGDETDSTRAASLRQEAIAYEHGEGGVARDPRDPAWAFCLAGTPLFLNMSFPGHRQMKSRNLGRYITFVINLREMLRCERIAYISGRPRNPVVIDKQQLLLPF